MFHRLNSFLKDEPGAVTVDWVVLCAGIVVLVVAIISAMQTGATDLSDATHSFMTTWFD
jgi:Flp pilus assembly pilin Flp